MAQQTTDTPAEKNEDKKSTKETYLFPEVGGTSISVEAESPEEAEKLVKQARKEQSNG